MTVTNLGVSQSVVTGRILRRETNARVSGATVQIRGVGKETLARADGYFVLLNVPTGAQLLDVRHPQYGLSTLTIEVGSPGKLIGSQAGAGGRIVGQARAATGAPWSDVQIVTEWGGLARGAQSRVDGSFMIDRVPPGVYMLTAERLGLAPLTKQVIVSDSTQTEVFFELESRPLGWRPSP